MSIENIRNDFYLFCRNLEQDYKFAAHHKLMCSEFQKCALEDNGRLLLSVPPGHSKSTLGSKMLPAWILGRNPKAKILLLTYGATLSNDFGKETRRYMQSAVYKTIFPDTVIEGDGLSGSFKTTEGGELRTIGRGGSITGLRADLIIIDDSIKNSEEAASNRILDKLKEWLFTTVLTRLLPGGSLICYNTRWCLRDAIGVFLDRYNNWKYINLKAICEDNDDPLGRDIGDALWPEWYPLSMLQDTKDAAPKVFQTLYQGNPVSEEATPIKLTNLLPNDKVSQQDRCIIAWDTASTKDGGDFTVATIWDIDKETATLKHTIRRQVDFNGLIELFNKLDKHFKPDCHIVENSSSGRQLIQLNEDICISSNAIKVKDKLDLAESLNYNLGRTIFIKEGALTDEMANEVAGFPYSHHDDIALSILHFYKNWLSKAIVKKRKTKATFISRRAYEMFTPSQPFKLNTQ